CRPIARVAHSATRRRGRKPLRPCKSLYKLVLGRGSTPHSSAESRDLGTAPRGGLGVLHERDVTGPPVAVVVHVWLPDGQPVPGVDADMHEGVVGCVDVGVAPLAHPVARPLATRS